MCICVSASGKGQESIDLPRSFKFKCQVSGHLSQLLALFFVRKISVARWHHIERYNLFDNLSFFFFLDKINLRPHTFIQINCISVCVWNTLLTSQRVFYEKPTSVDKSTSVYNPLSVLIAIK